MNNNNNRMFRAAYQKALDYSKSHWADFENGFPQVIELNDSWFFCRNKRKDNLITFDNVLGILVSKNDLDIRLCFGGTEEHHSLKEGTLIECPDDYLIQNDLSDKFVYQEGDIEIKKTQCEFCKFNISEDKCEKFIDGKPMEILEMNKRCPGLSLENKVDL